MGSPQIDSWLRFTFALPDPQPATQAKLLRDALDLVRYADENGISGVRVDEHHVTGYGWSPNPILEAGLLLAATKRIRVSARAALGPLYEPVRLAEDIALLDQLGGDRLFVCIGQGYRPIEYAAMRRSFEERGRLTDELLDTLLKAWSGKPFEYNGATIQVTPLPATKPYPNVAIGGSARATARRAVRYGLPLHIPAYLPELKAYYEQQCAEAGIAPSVTMVPREGHGPVFIAEDPEEAWAEIGPHFLWEAASYSAWMRSDMQSHMHEKAQTLDELRASGIWSIMSPQQCVEHLRRLGPTPSIVFHPLCGGIPRERAFDCLRLFVEEVVPRYERDG
jgi:alkanesulfonate monooxygenase SsuD/methylene tetrahydromethanopterin reductase-like flavin-dependent oxidoreductase (luciferase family)